MLFASLKTTLSDDLFNGKIHMNLSKDPPSNEFNEVFEQWISRSTNENPHIGPMHLESHYRVNPLLEFDNFKDVVDKYSRNVDVLNSKFGRIFIVFLIINSLNEDPNVYSQIDWKNVLSSLLCMKVTFKAIVCICDQKSFNNLVVTFQEEGFINDISMEYGFYQASKHEVPLSRSLGSWDEFATFGIRLPISFT